MMRVLFALVGLGHVALGAWNVKHRAGAQRVLGGVILALGVLLALGALAGCKTTDDAPTYGLTVESSHALSYGVQVWDGSAAPTLLFRSPAHAAWIGAWSFLLATDVTTGEGAHHNIAVCIGEDQMYCRYFDKAKP